MSLHISKTGAIELARNLARAFVAERFERARDGNYRCGEPRPDTLNLSAAGRVPLNYCVPVYFTPRMDGPEDGVVIDGGELLLLVNVETRRIQVVDVG